MIYVWFMATFCCIAEVLALYSGIINEHPSLRELEPYLGLAVLGGSLMTLVVYRVCREEKEVT